MGASGSDPGVAGAPGGALGVLDSATTDLLSTKSIARIIAALGTTVMAGACASGAEIGSSGSSGRGTTARWPRAAPGKAGAVLSVGAAAAASVRPERRDATRAGRAAA